MKERSGQDPRKSRIAIAVLVQALVILGVLNLGSVAPARGQETSPGAGASSERRGAVAEDARKDEGSAAAVDTEQQGKATAQLRDSERWAKSLEALRTGIDEGTASAEDADQLYAEVSAELTVRGADLAEALRWARAPDAQVKITPLEPARDTAVAEAAPETQTLAELHAIVGALYRTRIALLQYVTPTLRTQVTGASFRGFRELRGELGVQYLDFRYQSLWIPARVAEWPDLLESNPVSFSVDLLELLLALLVFRWWRGWAPTGIVRLQEQLVAVRPRRQRNLRLARFLWYLNRVRHPLEWLALLAVFAAVVDVPFSDHIEKVAGIVARWILLAWFTVVFLNAMVARGAAGLAGKAARLRLASIALVVAWLVLLGLGLDLAADRAGEGTIYAWVWLLFGALAIPLLLMLIALWRREIFRELEAEPRLPSRIERTLEHQRGPTSFAGAAQGGLYLIFLRLRQKFFEAISEHEFGRRLRAKFDTRDMVRESERLEDIREPIPPELRERLIVGAGKLVDKVARSELSQLVELAESGNGGTAFIVAERGGGKTTMLQRLKTRLDSQALILDCPPGGYEAFHEAFARALGLNAQEASPESLKRQLAQSDIRVVGIDNYHRLCRPMKDGDEVRERVVTLILSIGANLLWVGAIDRAAWQYMRQRRVEVIELFKVLLFSDWTEEQLGELIELRCAEADIDPDFGKLVLHRLGAGSGQETAAERNRLGFGRFLWNAADGNPGVAVRLFADSLVLTDGGGFEVRLPQQPAAAELTRLRISSLLVLRVIAQCELATPEEIAKSLRFPATGVRLAIAALHQHGWIEELDGQYRLSWLWFRTITRVLARKNLLPR